MDNQRLVRKLCTACRAPGTGCAACGHTGYAGRNGVFELLVVTEAIAELVHHNAAEAEIRTAALADGMVALREDCERLVESGITSREEILRAVKL